MGQFLDDARLARLRERTEVDMHWDFVDEDAAAGATLLLGEPVFEVHDDSISGRTILRDIHGSPYLTMRSHTPRSISGLGAQTVNLALLFLTAAGLLVTIFIWFMLRATILKPIEGLAEHMTKIRQSGDLTHQMAGKRNDEIGALAHQFDDLTGEVHDARQALLDQSFKAGKADTAAEVLHNIRNAMTPMINGLERLGRSFKVAGNLRIEEATAQIADPDCAPERKEKFLKYINASFKHVAGVGEEAIEDLKVATSQARQIEGILSDQEKFANVAPVAETLGVEEVIDEAVHVIPKDAQPEVDLDIPGELDTYLIRAHRIGLLQVLGNLILNAYESIQRSKAPNGRIRIEAASETFENKKMVRLTIRDNGGGFNKNTGERIFQRGFTSKTEGETNGLGLHWCANAVAGMGGRIQAESRGLGQGAEFHVLLPAAQGG
jgi:signal transduction histidine kinase